MWSLNLEPDQRAFVASMELNRRKVTDEDKIEFEGYAAEIFAAFGMDLNLSVRKCAASARLRQ